jgi:hypothetical protein
VNGEHTNRSAHPTEDERLTRLRLLANSSIVGAEIKWIVDEYDRLREVTTFPLITPEAPPGLYLRVLAEHEKGQPVNAQDLINALMWRVKNQREQLARLNRRVEEYRTDD